MSEFEMAYFDVKLFISKWTTGVIYKGLYMKWMRVAPSHIKSLIMKIVVKSCAAFSA